MALRLGLTHIVSHCRASGRSMVRVKQTARKALDSSARLLKEPVVERKWKGACTKSDCCVLANGHKGQCETGSFAEKEYTVEKIVSERDVYKNGCKVGTEYAVKWLDWPDSDMTWEPAASIAESAPNAILDWQDYWKSK